ncbi:hypothetical protein GCM10009757_39190 [Streptomyces cheonanensis]|uniref:Zf-HC2 domain-containing protein n=1 Tax=Streptomyces cheonanensis TaxID=312720 RepID=A0ABN2VD07_9ACTN
MPIACAGFRPAISARTEGEPLPAGVTDTELDAHLSQCRDCNRWARHLRALRAATDDLLHRRPRRGVTPPPTPM